MDYDLCYKNIYIYAVFVYNTFKKRDYEKYIIYF